MKDVAAATTATRARGTPKVRPQARDRLLSRMLASPDGSAMLALLLSRGETRLTEVDAVAPPGTLLDTVTQVIRDRTDLPPVLGLAVTHSVLAAAMAQQCWKVYWPDDDRGLEMAMWHVVLAPSGAGKTLVRNLVVDALGVQLRELPEPGSARAFLNELSVLNGMACWTRDEYGQLIKSIVDGGPMAQMRDYLLRAYDHAPLAVNTAHAGRVEIAHPVLPLFGSSVDSTWASCIDAAMLADGLLARHLFFVAERRPLSVPRYPIDEMKRLIAEAAAEVRQRLAVSHSKFRISAAAAALYDRLWLETVGQVGDRLDAAYFRRVAWSTARYAVIYHVLMCSEGEVVEEDAMRWAWRMTLLHLEYARRALALSDAGFASKIEKILGWVEQQSREGIDVTSNAFVRKLVQHFRRDLSNASEARQLIDLARKSGK